MTNLFGNRAVPVLSILFLFSSIEFLKTILDSLIPARLIEVSIDQNHTTHDTIHTLWALNGNIDYFKHLHILVFLATAFFFIFLWLPYTLLLLLLQWKSHFRLLRWVPRLTPVYDAYIAPLKDKHHYWFGVLLVARCIHIAHHPHGYLYFLSKGQLCLASRNYCYTSHVWKLLQSL